VILTDDLDGKELPLDEGETVSFALDGVNYEIDLGKKNAQKLRDDLSAYASAGRRAEGRGRTGRRTGRAGSNVDPSAVRAWARSNNVDVNQRGRIPGSVIEQYKAAGN
jgi:hypothetical protein